MDGFNFCNWQRAHYVVRLRAASVEPLDAVPAAMAAPEIMGLATSHTERTHQGPVGGTLDVVAVEVNSVAIAIGVTGGVVGTAAVASAGLAPV